ncbi:MAG TPA: isoprenylcysteine carboxylmethyltransferase family protein [Anaerolineae bacterium]|jgi:protein-S-isoprenylcysteine O-methyltransferase Ste14|nr:isoprenylcysteine carboxylmethyltransferase family protein [Anaerolineae bacterium]
MLLHQLAAVLILPFNVLLVIPGLLFLQCRNKPSWGLFPASARSVTRALGGLLILAGLPLLLWTIRDFGRIGQGSLAPWDPPKKLVVRGPYRHVRNPMISAVMAILFGQALLLNSLCHLAWAALFSLGNALYIPRSEEPGLEKRFGADYRRYKQNVRRWQPRLEPWYAPFAK